MKAVTLTLFAMCIFSLTISAKKMSKEEEKMLDTVVVTTSDGSVHNGTVKKYWTAHHGGGYNKEFSIVADDGSELKFNAAAIDSIYFPMRDDGMLKVWRVLSFLTRAVDLILNFSNHISPRETQNCTII